MSYIDGYVLAVPKANRGKFIDYAKAVDGIFIKYGALRVTECWGDDLPIGKQTDFFMAVAAKDDETVVFSWVEWPDKATRDEGMEQMMAEMETDELFDQKKNPMPFDGLRMIYGSFETVVDLGNESSE